MLRLFSKPREDNGEETIAPHLLEWFISRDNNFLGKYWLWNINWEVIKTLETTHFQSKKWEIIQSILQKYPCFWQLRWKSSDSLQLWDIPSDRYKRNFWQWFRQLYLIPRKENEKIKLERKIKSDFNAYVNESEELISNLLNTALRYYMWPERNESLFLMAAWYKNKLETNPSFYQRWHFELLDIFEAHQKEGVCFWCIPEDVVEKIMEIISMQYIINILIYEIGNYINYWRWIYPTAQIENIHSCVDIVLQEIWTLKEQIQNTEIIQKMLFLWNNIPQKRVETYENSKLFEMLSSWIIEIYFDGKSYWHPVSDDAWLFIHQLVYSGWDFLMDVENSKSLLIYLAEVESSRRSEILNFTQKKMSRWISIEGLLGLIVCEIESFPFIQDVTSEEIETITKAFIRIKEDGELYKIACLDALRDWNKDEIFYIISLHTQEIIDICSKKYKKEDIFGVKSLLEAMSEDIVYLPEEHPSYIWISLLISDTPRIWLTLKEVKSAQENLYKSEDTGKYIELHRELFRSGKRLDTIFKFFPSIYNFSGKKFEIYQDTLQRFLGLNSWLQERVASFFWEYEYEDGFNGIINLLTEFCSFMTDNNLWGETDLQEYFQMFLSEQTLSEESTENQKEDDTTNDIPPFSINESLQEIFWEHYGNAIITIWFQDILRHRIISIGWELDEYMLQLFAVFLTEYKSELHDIFRENENILIERLWLFARVYSFLKTLQIRELRNPEKLFEFIILNATQKSDIDFMIHTLDESIDIQEHYEEIRKCIMRYLKHKDRNILLSYINGEDTKEDNDISIVYEEVTKKDKKAKKYKSNGSSRKGKNLTQGKRCAHFNDAYSRELHYRLIEASFSLQKFKQLIDEEVVENPNKLWKEIYAYIVYRSYEIGIELGDVRKKALLWKMNCWSWNLSLLAIRRLLLVTEWADTYSQTHISNILIICRNQLKSISYTYNTRDITIILSRLQYLSSHETAFSIINTLLHNIQIENFCFSQREIWNILKALYPYKESEYIWRVVKLLFKNLSNYPNISDINAVNLMQVFSLYHKNIPATLRTRFEKARKNLDEGPNKLEKRVYAIIRRFYPHARIWEYIDGFECDIVIPEKYVIIEVDGQEYHEGKASKKDAFRDEYLKNGRRKPRKWYTTFRLNTWSADINEDLLKILQDISQIKVED